MEMVLKVLRYLRSGFSLWDGYSSKQL